MSLLPMPKSARNIHRSWFAPAKALQDKNLSNQIKKIEMSYFKGSVPYQGELTFTKG